MALDDLMAFLRKQMLHGLFGRHVFRVLLNLLWHKVTYGRYESSRASTEI